MAKKREHVPSGIEPSPYRPDYILIWRQGKSVDFKLFPGRYRSSLGGNWMGLLDLRDHSTDDQLKAFIVHLVNDYGVRSEDIILVDNVTAVHGETVVKGIAWRHKR